MWGNKRRQQGAALIEMALVLPIFLLLVFGTLELGMAYFKWARTNEAARDAARYLIVNNALTDLAALDCPDGDPLPDVVCSSSTCSEVLNVIHRVAPFVAANQVSVRYGCSQTGNPALPPELVIPEVTVAITGVTYEFVVPTLIGLNSPLGIPAARVSRTGEDLFTEGGS